MLVDLGGGLVVTATAVALLAQQQPPPGQGEEFGKASPIGLVVILLLALATVFLIRSMSKRIRRLPASFDDPPEPGGDPNGRDPNGRDPDEGDPRMRDTDERDADGAERGRS